MNESDIKTTTAQAPAQEPVPKRFKSDPDRNAVFGHGFADIIDQYDWNDTLRIVESAPRSGEGTQECEAAHSRRIRDTHF